MSIKLYNGYIVNNDVYYTFDKLKSILPIIEDRIDEIYTIDLFERTIEEYDRLPSTGDDKTDLSKFGELKYKYWREDFEECKNPEHYSFELHSARANVFPLSKKITLLTFFVSNQYNNEILKILTSQNDWLHDYHYQDQCDKPDDILERDWKKRYRIWSKAFGKDNVMWENHGCTLQFTFHDRWNTSLSRIFFVKHNSEEFKKIVDSINRKKKIILNNLILNDQTLKEKQGYEYLCLFRDLQNKFEKDFQDGIYSSQLDDIKLKVITNE